MNLLARQFKNKVTEDLKILNGEEFERFARIVLELYLGEKVIHKGQNLFAKPVGYTADFADARYKIIGQAGTDPDYFDNYDKPLDDISSGIKNHPSASTIFLFSNRYAGTSRLGDLITEAKNHGFAQKIMPFDSERIAETILDRMLASHIIEQILEYLPSAQELFRLFPKVSQLPSNRGKYFDREEEDIIIEKLATKPIIQIYGLSGIGKTELAIKIARKEYDKYDTILWIDCDFVGSGNIDFAAVKIQKFDKSVNLTTILSTYKCLLIFDNANLDTAKIRQEFLKFNGKESRCLLTSLTKTLDSDSAFNLEKLSDENARKILSDNQPALDEKTTKTILDYTGNHPLVLRIINSAVCNNILTWNDALEELEEIHQLPDAERNQTVANRIIGRILHVNEKELSTLNFIGGRIISRPLLECIANQVAISKLLNIGIMQNDGSKYYSIHQIILDSISTENPNDRWDNEFSEKVKSYLIAHNEIKDAGYFNVIANHKLFLQRIGAKQMDSEFQRIILYAEIQCTDLHNENEVNRLLNRAKALIQHNTTYYENLLFIEMEEAQLFRINKISAPGAWSEKLHSTIKEFELLLARATTVEQKVVLQHHIGKLYSKAKNYDAALTTFETVLQLKHKDVFAYLQIARIATQKGDKKRVSEIATEIFGRSDCPQTILLAFYELIAQNANRDLRTKYVDDRIDAFTLSMVQALDARFDQPYAILAKLSGHLSYNFPENFLKILESMPEPINLESNSQLRLHFAQIYASYYKYMKFNPNGEASTKNLDLAFTTARKHFESLRLENDYTRGLFVDLLIEGEDYETALKEAHKFQEKKSFNLQKLSKIHRGLGEFEVAIACANEAIALESEESGSDSGYIAAFLHDRAEAEFALGDKICIATLDEAIDKQGSPKTQKIWHDKRSIWLTQIDKTT